MCIRDSVDAEQRRVQHERPLQLARIVNFHQHVHAQSDGQLCQFAQRGIVQSRHDQQNAVRANRAGFINLIKIDGEILAQHRQLAGRARLL